MTVLTQIKPTRECLICGTHYTEAKCYDCGSSFLTTTKRECRGCHVEWRCHSVELHVAFEEHEKKCLAKQ